MTTGAERLPSARLDFSVQLTPLMGLQAGVMRLAPDRTRDVTGYDVPLKEELALYAGVGGLRFNVTRGAVRIAPFVEAGAGRLQAHVDSGGYSIVGGGYQPHWRKVDGLMLGGGAGLALDLILGPGVTLSAGGGYWYFRSPDEIVEPVSGVFVGAGVRLALRNERWYWRTSGNDLDGPDVRVLAPVPNAAGALDVGEAHATIRLLVSDLSGIREMLVDDRPVRLASAPAEPARQSVGDARLAVFDVTLSPGPNRVRVTARDGAGNERIRVLEVWGMPLDRNAPTVAVISPADGSSMTTNRVLLVGVAADEGDVAEVTVNGLRARIAEASATDLADAGIPAGQRAYRFEANVPLQAGRNVLQILASDTAANQEVREVVVHGPEAVAVARPGEPEAMAGARPIIEIVEPQEWASLDARGLVAARKRSVEVRGTVRYANGIGDVRVAGRRASLDMDATGTIANFMGFVPVTGTTREVVVEARGADGAYATRVFELRPAAPEETATPGDFAAAAGDVQRQRWAVVVGISEYADPNIPDLRFADADARAVHAFLTSPAAGLGGIPADHVQLLVNEQATERNIRTALLTFLRRSTPDDIVFIYLAGHGMPDPERLDDLYLLAHDTDLDNLAVTGIPMALVQEAVGRAFSYNTIVITDACHSAGVGAGAARAVNVNQINAEFLDRMNASTGGLVAFTASESNQLSQEGEQYGGGHGVFTHFMLEALDGAADEDGDHIVTLGEMMEYTRDRVRRETSNAQVPSISLTPYDRYWPMAIVLENR